MSPNRPRIRVLSCLFLSVLAGFGIATATRAADPPERVTLEAPANLDFETGELGTVPAGWISPTQGGGFVVSTTEESPHEGSRCAEIRRDATEATAPFGNLMQTVDAAPYRGKRFRLRAFVRTDLEGFASRAQLWVRVDRAGGGMGFFDNMGDRPITATKWTAFEIEGAVAEDAEDVNFGIFLAGEGKVWIDAVKLEVLGEVVRDYEAPRPLQGRALDNLVAFTRLLGYVRHFHPAETVAAADWDRFAIDGVRAAEGARDASDLAARLEALFHPLAPTVQVYPTDAPCPPLHEALAPPPDETSPRIVWWRHFGVGMGGKGSIYSSTIVDNRGGGGEEQGALMHSLNAEPYRGKRVRFSAWMRAEMESEDVSAGIAIWVQRGSAPGFNGSTEDQPVRSNGWVRREIVGEIEDDATRIHLMAGLDGPGTAWFDDLALEVVEEAPDHAESVPGKTLDFENDEPEAEPEGWHLYQQEHSLRFEVAVTADRPHGGDRCVRLAGSSKPEGDRPVPEQPFRADLGGGVSCVVPLALYADREIESPALAVAPETLHEPRPEGWLPSGNDRATRLAGVALAWNVLQHFYPYFDVVETDWAGSLSTALERAATDSDERAFLRTLRRLVSALHDGHGRVGYAGEWRNLRGLPVLWEWIEDRLVVTEVAEEAAERVRPGDVVATVDGRPVPEVLAEREAEISSATPQWRRHRSVSELRMCEAGDEMGLRVRTRSGTEKDITMKCSLPIWGEGALEETRPAQSAEVAPGIRYLDVGRADDAAFRAAIPELAQAKGIVMDLRGYPRVQSQTLIAHLTDENVHSAQWHVPAVLAPDRADMRFEQSGWPVEPASPRFTENVVFLTDGRAISAAETLLGIVEHYGLAEILGSPTAGTNGNVNPFSLPGGYQVMWTGMKVLKHDGSRHHGVGILPAIPASRTVVGVAAGRDELLERAVEWLSAHIRD